MLRKRKTDCTNNKTVHIYEDLDKFSPLYEEISASKLHENSSNVKESKVVFEKSKMLPPAYSSSVMPVSNASKESRKEKRGNSNDYQIVYDKSTKSTMEKCKSNLQNEQEDNDMYIHCK